MLSGFDTIKRDSSDSQNGIRSRLRGTKSLSDLSAMAAESARIDRENRLLGSIRKIYTEDWQREGVGPHPDNITANPALLKVLSRPGWLQKLQNRGIEVNKPTLELISRRLKEIDPSNLLDYNTAIKHFNETLDKFKSEDVAELRVEPAGLRGGISYVYDERSQQYYGRTITLRDPEGGVHALNKGEDSDEIANFTARRIEHYKRQYNTEYDKGKALTEEDVEMLREGKHLHGWECIELREFSLQKRTCYTDKGTEINALDLSTYQSYSRQDHDELYPPSRYTTLGDPTPTYNCHSIFIGRTAWLVPEKRGEYHETQIRRILVDNGYYSIHNANAKIGDIVAYYDTNGEISHTAIVSRVDPDRITVESKPGDAGLIQHDMYDEMISQNYGKPTIYRTNRVGGHLLMSQEAFRDAKRRALSGAALLDEKEFPEVHPKSPSITSPSTMRPIEEESSRNPYSEGQMDRFAARFTHKPVSDIDEHRARAEAKLAKDIGSGNMNKKDIPIYKSALDIAYTHFDLYKRGERLAQCPNSTLQKDSAEFIQLCKEWTVKELIVRKNSVGFIVPDNIITALIELKDSKANIEVLPGLASIVHDLMKPHVRINNQLALEDWPSEQVTYPQNRGWWNPPPDAFLYHASQRIKDSIRELDWWNEM